ncbi:MAG TPA: hypothetical protein PLZ67_07580 [Bacteroidales bacterium]|nr:hypothetical protein [Bacteroidales bacterium]
MRDMKSEMGRVLVRVRVHLTAAAAESVRTQDFQHAAIVLKKESQMATNHRTGTPKHYETAILPTAILKSRMERTTSRKLFSSSGRRM